MNDDRKFAAAKEAALDLLKMEMPNIVLEKYFRISNATVHKYAIRLRKEGVWHGRNTPLNEAIPRMVALIAAIRFKRAPLDWMELENVDKPRLRESLEDVLEISKIQNAISYAQIHLAKLRQFGFHPDIPPGYRNLLNAINSQPSALRYQGDFLWRDYLLRVTHIWEKPTGAESLKKWQENTINEILEGYSRNIRPEIMPVLPIEICAKIEDDLFPTLHEREVRVLKKYFGINEKKLKQREIAEEMETSNSVVGQIVNRAIRRIKHESRLELILAMPLTWERVNRILKEKLPPSPVAKPGQTIEPEDALRIRLSDLNFSIRAKNVFLAAEVSTIGELINIPENDLRKFRNIGSKTISEIQIVLARYKLRLK